MKDPPQSVTNIFGNWLNGIDHRFKKTYKGESNCFYVIAMAI
jgi:hypothetical protein